MQICPNPAMESGGPILQISGERTRTPHSQQVSGQNVPQVLCALYITHIPPQMLHLLKTSCMRQNSIPIVSLLRSSGRAYGGGTACIRLAHHGPTSRGGVWIPPAHTPRLNPPPWPGAQRAVHWLEPILGGSAVTLDHVRCSTTYYNTAQSTDSTIYTSHNTT